MPEAAPFTIVVCTRNRAPLLKLCLESVVGSQRDWEPVPVIVVDNGSCDDTPNVIRSFAHRLSIVPLHESTVGLSVARNLAIGRCTTAHIVFLDDDAQVDPGWICAIREGLVQWRPDCFGGPYRPYYLTQKPPWFRDGYASRNVDRQAGPLSGDELLSGGNMGWSTTVLRDLGGFCPHLGMRGTRLGVGEETELQFRLVQQRPNDLRVFLPDMSIRHLVSIDKLRVRYWLRRAWVTGWTHDRVRHGREPIPWWTAPRLLAAAAALLIALPVRDRRRHPYWQSYIIDRLAPKLKLLAIVASRLWLQ